MITFGSTEHDLGGPNLKALKFYCWDEMYWL